MKNIYLVGFMGSGKSYIGEMLARALKVSFIDLDSIIETESSMSISEIFKIKGEEYFRVLETKHLLRTTQLNNHVIALGGGTFCTKENINIALKNGVVVYLNANSQIIYNRLVKNRENRPLISNFTTIELKNYIRIKTKERSIYYNQAHITFMVDKDNMPVDELVYFLTI